MHREPVRAFGGERGLRWIVSLAFGISACAPHTASVAAVSPAHGGSGLCELLVPPTAAATSLRITVTDAITPGDAPFPRTDAERVIFPLLYTPPAPSTDPCHDPSQSTRTESVDATSHVRATPASPEDTASTVVPPTPPSSVGVWPATTGHYDVATAVDTALDLVPRRSTVGPALHVSRIKADAGRDALDDGTDVLITSDATTIAYAAARSDFVSVPLPWSRVYVLIQPDGPAHIDLDSVRALDDGLAVDAVRVEARGADDPQWGEALATCDTAGSAGRVAAPDASRTAIPPNPPSPAAASLANRIVYAEDDEVARAVGERLVALVNQRDPRVGALAPALTARPAARTASFDSTQMRAALITGRDAAYVASIRVTGLCRDVAALIAEAPWVASDPHRLGETLTPLIETRAHAIVRRGRVGVAVDNAGDVYLEFGPAAGS